MVYAQPRRWKFVDFVLSAVNRIKLKESETMDVYLDLAKRLKKLWNLKVTIILIVIGAFRTVTKELLKDWRTWKLVDEWRPFKLQDYWEQPEYWEGLWRHEETCCFSNSSEKPSATTDVKNYQRLNNNNNKLWDMKVTVIPIVIGALRTICDVLVNKLFRNQTISGN